MQITFTHQAQGNAVAKLRIDAGHPCLHDSRRVLLAQSTGHLEGKAQPLFRIAINFAAGYPAVHGANIFTFAM